MFFMICALFSFVQSNELFLEELIYKTSMQHDDAVIAASMAMIGRKDYSDVLTKLSCPALFIVGCQDNAIALHHSLAQLSLASVASVHIFEDVGHMAMFEKKETCIKRQNCSNRRSSNTRYNCLIN